MSVRQLSMARWITLCAVAEAIGMTAAATAAKASRALVGEPGNPREASLILTLVVAGGLIEGLAPEAEWSVPAVVAVGTATGLVAGAVLGLVSWWFLGTLDGPAAYNPFVLCLLGSSAHRALGRSLVALRVRGVVTGQVFELPVQYAADDSMVILPGRPEAKRWWRNLAEPAPVDVLLQGRWQHGEGLVLRPGDPGYDTAVGAYRHRWPRVRMPGDSPLVHVRLLADPPAGPSSSADSFSVLVPAAAQTPPTDSAAPGSRVRC